MTKMTQSSLGNMELTPDKSNTLKSTEIKKVSHIMQNALQKAKQDFDKEIKQNQSTDKKVLEDIKKTIILKTIKEKVSTLTDQELGYYTAENNAQAKWPAKWVYQEIKKKLNITDKKITPLQLLRETFKKIDPTYTHTQETNIATSDDILTIMSIQEKYGIQVDGVAGTKTREVINNIISNPPIHKETIEDIDFNFIDAAVSTGQGLQNITNILMDADNTTQYEHIFTYLSHMSSFANSTSFLDTIVNNIDTSKYNHKQIQICIDRLNNIFRHLEYPELQLYTVSEDKTTNKLIIDTHEPYPKINSTSL